MNNPAAIKAITTRSVRASIKAAIHTPHQSLERLPIMHRYSTGVSSAEEYMAVTRLVQAFWTRHIPTTHRLPEGYCRFLEAYLGALRLDVGVPSPVQQLETVDELAFYYVLLGSGLGAKIILKNNAGNDLPKNNLQFLAKHSSPLWTEFIGSHLENVPEMRENAVTEDSCVLFERLLDTMQKLPQGTL